MANGKTEKEIIDELISKGKYDEWVNLGSYFGLTSYTLKTKYFLVRPYKYYNIDDKIVNVSMISKNYRPDVNNIAVFKQIIEFNPLFVNQNTYKIASLNEELITSGLASCSCLAIIIGNNKFMAHIDATSNIFIFINAISNLINEEIELINLIPYIYAGCIFSEISLSKTIDICKSIGIPEINYKIKTNVNMFDNITI